MKKTVDEPSAVNAGNEIMRQIHLAVILPQLHVKKKAKINKVKLKVAI
jgi:hypothetical protein